MLVSIGYIYTRIEGSGLSVGVEIVYHPANARVYAGDELIYTSPGIIQAEDASV